MLAIAALLLATWVPPGGGDLIDALLRVPVARPAEPRSMRNGPPAPDAPFATFAGWWAAAGVAGDFKAPPEARARLVEAFDREPELVPPLIGFFPATSDVCARAAAWSEAHERDETVAHWRLLHCADRRAELIEAAAAAHETAGFFEGALELEALAESDWTAAEPLLAAIGAGRDQSIAVLALTLAYRHGNDEALRCRLQSIATDRTQPAYARDKAIEELSQTEWDGHDAWLESLFADPTLAHARDDWFTYMPLASIAARDPERWIPICARLLGSSDRVVHSAAANALASFQLDSARADALRPLLPWIGDPQWADEASDERLRLVQSVAKVGLAEAIPELRRAIADEDQSVAAYAADALNDFHATVDPKALRAALARAEAQLETEPFVVALINAGDLGDDEMARGLVAYAAHTPGPLSIIGAYVALRIHDRDGVASRVLARLPELAPEVAKELRRIIMGWPVPSVDRDIVARVGSGTATAEEIVTILNRRGSARAELPGGAPRGFAAVLNGDRIEEAKILAGADAEAQRMLLACARLTHEPLDVDAVVPLFGRKPALDRAAEEWLAADDSPRARQAIAARHPNDIRILGGDPLAPAVERKVVDDFLRSDDDEWFALLSAGTWLHEGVDVVVAVRGDVAVAITKTGRTPVAPAVLRELRDLISSTNFDELPSLETGVADGRISEYLHLRRGGYGRRVVMNNAFFAGGTPYATVDRRLLALAALR